MEALATYGTVSPIWRGEEVWVVASGPSASKFDLGRLRGKRVIAVNDACFMVSSASSLAVAAFSLDNDWVRGHRDFLTASRWLKYVALPLETWPDCAGIPGVTYLRWGYEAGVSDDPAVVNTGGNSGYGALNLAWLMGARYIHLVGYDMDGAEEKYRQWVPRFAAAAAQLRVRGVTVVNHNPRSAITVFASEEKEKR